MLETDKLKASSLIAKTFLGHSKIEETLDTYTHLYSNALSAITNLIVEINEGAVEKLND